MINLPCLQRLVACCSLCIISHQTLIVYSYTFPGCMIKKKIVTQKREIPPFTICFFSVCSFKSRSFFSVCSFKSRSFFSICSFKSCSFFSIYSFKSCSFFSVCSFKSCSFFLASTLSNACMMMMRISTWSKFFFCFCTCKYIRKHNLPPTSLWGTLQIYEVPRRWWQISIMLGFFFGFSNVVEEGQVTLLELSQPLYFCSEPWELWSDNKQSLCGHAPSIKQHKRLGRTC